MIKAVVFDWGGVMAPLPNGGWLNVLADMLNSTVEEIKPHWRAAEYRKFCAGLIEEDQFCIQLEASLGRRLPADLDKVWREGSAFTPWPEMQTFNARLRQAGITTALLSNTVRPQSTMFYEEGLFAGFDYVVLSDEVGVSKPDPQIFKLLLERVGRSASECVFIDDMSKNLVSAEGMGFKVVLGKDPKQIIADVTRELEISGAEI